MQVNENLEVTAWIRARDPELSVELNTFERNVEVKLGDNWHGEVLHLTFSHPGWIHALGRRLLDTSRELAEIHLDRD